MSTQSRNLQTDLTVLEAMAAEMEMYLDGETLFWVLGNSALPRLTLGGYLMRAYRLSVLRHLLNKEERGRLDTAVFAFETAVKNRTVRFETRTHEEAAVRGRQWGSYLDDLLRDADAFSSGYASAVESRAMLSAIVDRLKFAPYQMGDTILAQVKLLDQKLASIWTTGDFVWPPAWEEAYPPTAYWWLYGSPR